MEEEKEKKTAEKKISKYQHLWTNEKNLIQNIPCGTKR